MNQSPFPKKLLYACVNQEECIACGLCQLKSPHLFEYNDEGIAYLSHDKNTGQKAIPAEEQESFKQAYINCPTGAIKRFNSPSQ